MRGNAMNRYNVSMNNVYVFHKGRGVYLTSQRQKPDA